MSIKEALQAALESDDVIDDAFAEELEVLEEEVPDAAEVFSDIVSVEADIGMLKLLEASVEGREITELDRGVYNQVRARYCMEAVSVESADSFQRQVVGFRMGLEAAVMASMEGWSIADVWDKISGAERESGELADNLRAVKANMNWFGDNAIAIRAISDLKFFSINNKPSTNIAADATVTVKVLTTLIDAAKETLDTADQMLADIRSAKIKSDADAKRLLDKVSGYKNPLGHIASSVINTPILGNWKIGQTTTRVNYNDGNVANWSILPEFKAEHMGNLQKIHGKGTTKFITIPTWLLFAATLGGTNGKLAMLSTMAVTGVPALAAVAGIAVMVTTANIFKDAAKSAVGGFKDKHHVTPAALIEAFEKLQRSTDALVTVRRSASGKKGNVDQFVSQAKTAVNAHKGDLSSVGVGYLDDVAKIAATAHRSGWSAMVNSTNVTFGIVRGANRLTANIAKKIEKK